MITEYIPHSPSNFPWDNVTVAHPGAGANTCDFPRDICLSMASLGLANLKEKYPIVVLWTMTQWHIQGEDSTLVIFFCLSMASRVYPI